MYKNAGFASLRLLVVLFGVLLIGISAVVGRQQYQLSVAKNRYLRGVTVVDAVWRAQQLLFMTNATYAPGFTGLKIRLPSDVKKRIAGKDEDVWENEAFIFIIRAENGVGRQVGVKIKNTDTDDAPQYIRYFNAPHAQCYAPRSAKIWNKVCLDYGGKFASADPFFNIYDL